MSERSRDDVECPRDVDALEAARDEAWQAHQRGEPGAGLRYARCVDRLCNLRHELQRYGTLRWEDCAELRLHDVDPAVTDEERVALGVPPLAETRAEIALENRWRAESRAAEQGLPDGVEVARVWRPCSARAVRERWDREGVPVWADGDELTLVWRGEAEEVLSVPGIQLPLWRLDGSDLWLLTVRVRDLPAAAIGYGFWPQPPAEGRTEFLDSGVWRGPLAPPAPARATTLAGAVEEHTLNSAALGGPRALTVYVPPGHDPARPLPVVYASDGQAVSGLAEVVDPLIDTGELPACVLVGVHCAEGQPGDDQRSAEYLPGWDAQAFEAHHRFFVDEVAAWAQAHLGVAADRRLCAVSGYSNGAAFSAAMGVRHPDRYGHVFAFSLGLPPAAEPTWPEGRAPRHYLAAGTLEFWFRKGTARWASTLQRLGVDHVHRERVCGHDPVLWEEEFLAALAWAFG